MANTQNQGGQTGSMQSGKDGGMDKVKEQAQGMTREVRHQAQEAASQAQDQAMSMARQRKEQAANQLDTVARAFRQTGEQLRKEDNQMVARYTENVADQVERVASYLHDGDLNQFLSDAQDFARKQPELFLGGAFTLGLLAARFFKSSAPNRGYSSSYRSYPQRSEWQGYRGSRDWTYEEGRRYDTSGYDTGRYAGSEVDEYSVPTGATTTGTTTQPGSATAGRTAGMTAGTTAASTTAGGQTTSRRTFDTEVEPGSKREEKKQ